MHSILRTRLLISRALLVGTFLFVLGVGQTSAEGGSLEKSLKAGKKEIQFSGKEKGDLRISKGTHVTGSSPDKAVISGDIVMADGSSLTNVTVNGKKVAITLDAGANVRLTNVTVVGASDVGIFGPKGGGTLILSDSRISQNRKGLFLLGGKRLVLSGSSITNNQEEGLDMHAGTSGSITGSTFANNKEGGMEVIINGSSFTLSGNTFSGNTASGIALQSYGSGGGGAKVGSFLLDGNTFVNNGNFGIDCKNPQGTGGAFFGTSVKATGNTFTNNKKGSTNGECGIRNHTRDEKIAGDTEVLLEESLEKELQEEAVINEIVEQAAMKREQIEALQQEAGNLEERVAVYIQNKKQQSGIGHLVMETPQERSVGARLLETHTSLKKRVEACVVVDTYDVSMQTAVGHFLCTSEEQQALRATLEEIASQLHTSTYREKVNLEWRQLTQSFLDFWVRLEW